MKKAIIFLIFITFSFKLFSFNLDSLYQTRLKSIENVIPFKLTESVKESINLKISNREESEKLIKKSKEYYSFIEMMLFLNGIPKEFKYASIPDSNKFWNIHYIIGIKYGMEINDTCDDRKDIVKSTIVSMSYLKDLHKMYDDWTLVLFAYLTSPSCVNSAINRSNNSDPYIIYEYIECKEKKMFIDFISTAYFLSFYKEHGF